MKPHRVHLALTFASLVVALPAGAQSPSDRIAPGGVEAPPSNVPGAGLIVGVNEYTFRYHYVDAGDPSKSLKVEYRIPVDPVTVPGKLVRDGALAVEARVDDGPAFWPVSDGGVRYRKTVDHPGPVDEEIYEPYLFRRLARTIIAPPVVVGETLELHYTDIFVGLPPFQRVHEFSLDGSALRVRIRDEGTATATRDAEEYYCGFSPGRSALTTTAVDFTPPYSAYPVAAMDQAGAGVFYGAYTDPEAASTLIFDPYRNPTADGLAVGMITKSVEDYDVDGMNDTNEVSVFDETVYVAASSRILDVVPHPFVGADVDMQARRDDLDHRVTLDLLTQTEYQEYAGTELQWVAPADLPAGSQVDVDVLYQTWSFSNPLGGGGRLRFEVRREEELLHEHVLLVGDVTAHSWTATVPIAANEALRFRVDSMGTRVSDRLHVRPVVTLGGVDDDAVLSFDSTQGPTWHYRQFFEETVCDLEYEPTLARWVGFVYPWPEALPVPATEGLLGDGVDIVTSITPLVTTPALVLDPTPLWGPSLGQWFERLANAGLRDVAAIVHFWTAWGFDNYLPDQHPASPVSSVCGSFVDAVADGTTDGFLVALHENYLIKATEELPPYEDDGLVAKNQYGTLKQGGETLALDHAKWAFETEVAPPPAYQPNSSYLDANTVASAEWAVDLDTANPDAKTTAVAYDRLFELYDAVSDFYDGPLFGEGGDQSATRLATYQAGYQHGNARQLFGRVFSHTLPDFELAAVRPLMVGQGMGLHGRYFPFRDFLPELTIPEGDELDRYDVQTILYGHGGWLDDRAGVETGPVGEPLVASLEVLMREYAHHYYEIRAIQERTLVRTDEVDAVLYELPGGGAPKTLSEAVANGDELANAKITVDYASGLKVRGNFDTGIPRASTITDFSSLEDQHGWKHVYKEVETQTSWDTMTWNPLADMYEGTQGGFDSSNPRMEDHLALPAGKVVGRAYLVPETGEYDLTLFVAHAVNANKLGVGDGLLARIYHDDGVTQTIIADGATEWVDGDYTALELVPNVGAFTNPISATAGDVFTFALEPYMTSTGENTMFTYPLVERVSAGQDPTWTIVEGGSTYELPTFGHLVTATSPALTAFSGRVDGSEHIDYVSTASALYPYEYLRSRSGNPVSHGRLTTDGAAVITPWDSAGRDELHLFEGTHLDDADLPDPDKRVLELSVEGHCHVLWLDEDTIEILPTFTAGHAPVDITYRGLLGISLPPLLTPQVVQIDPAGDIDAGVAFTLVQGELTIPAAHPGWTYRFSWQ